MADGSSEETWWGWLQTAKDKVVSQSSEVLEFVKNDIDEFTKVVSEEASSAVSSTASALKTKLNLDDDASTANHVKKSMSGFLSHVAEVFTPPPDDDDEEAFVISNQQPIMLSRLEANLYAKIQQPDVFLNEPTEEEFKIWLEKFDMKDKQVEVADLLVSCKPLHKHFSDLVPNEVSHNVFWQRYFFLEHRLQQQEEKRKQISSRALDTKADLDKQDMLWEDGDSNEDEWEKVEAATEDGDSGIVSPGSVGAEGEALTDDTTAPAAAPVVATAAASEGDKPKGEDWETWE